jgi:cyclopropane-fatty-acyl-phospholipid synthase
MKHSAAEAIVKDLLSGADIQIGGDRAWDIQVHNKNFYRRVVAEGTLGLGEAYMDGWWDCVALDEFFDHVIRADLESSRLNVKAITTLLLARLSNLQSRRRSTTVAEAHYDLGNDLFQEMLDRRMIYSCAYWKNATNLDEAQEAKLELVCKKLELRPGLKVLDIGCGWGGFAIYAADRYGVDVVGVTNSREQFQFTQARCKALPVEVRLQDFRDISGRFDRIVSIGMLEHVGHKNYKTFMDIVYDSLDVEGICLLHTICNNVSTRVGDPWLAKYVFPNSMTPSLAQLSRAIEGRFVVEDIHNIGPGYDPTCMAWHRNFQQGWPRLKGRYGERFRRLWQYYLLMAAGNFRARSSQVLQFVLTRMGRAQPDCR